MKVNPSLALDFVNILGFVTLSRKLNDGKSDIFLKDKLFIKENGQSENLN